MPKKIIIFLIVVIVIIGVLYLVRGMQGEQEAKIEQGLQPISEEKVSQGENPSSVPQGKEHVVELQEDGFSPETITIKKGDTVKFVTKNKTFFWPASDLHPTHTIYPEFDPREPIASSSSWSFRFEKVGDWKYHDHLAPYYTGVVRVVE